VERDANLTRKIGEAARAALSQVFEEWNSEADWTIKRATEARIAAACLVYKPLYWDPWGEASAAIRSRLLPLLPAGSNADATNAGLLVFRPEIVRPIIDSDPTFYRPRNESLLSALRRVSRTGDNGELLGYGARSIDAPGGVPVRIFNDEAKLFASFVSDPSVAEFYAQERLLDIALYIDEDLSFSIGS
jgi:hypothetical protein